MKGVKHYTKNGDVWEGKSHKMDDGTLHTGATHTKSSKELVHKKDLSSTLKMKTSPALLKLSASCKAAARKKVKFDTRFVEQGGYKGDVMLYPKSFLDEYFGGGIGNGNNKQILFG